MIKKMLNELRKRTDEHNKKFKRVRKYREDPNRAKECNNENVFFLKTALDKINNKADGTEE